MIKDLSTLNLKGFTVSPEGLLYRPCGAVCNSKNQQGYGTVHIQKNIWLTHRVIFFLHNGYCPDIVDHVDRNKFNNIPQNLREATHSSNNHNKDVTISNNSGIVGVHWCKSRIRWVASIDLQSKRHIKRFKTKQEAINQRKEWEIMNG